MASDYLAPTRLEDALAALQSQEAVILAGGTDYFPTLGRQPEARPILDVTRIAGLRGISGTPAGGWRIGAATTWTDIARADLPAGFAGLQAAAREVGSVQIQNTGTIAGNLCNASPAADGVPPLLTLEAEVELTSATGRRALPLSDFITGVRQTALARGEILSAVLIPPLPDHAGAGFAKLGARRYLVISISMAAALVTCDRAGRIARARVAVGACSAVAQRLHRLEADLIGTIPGEIAVTAAHLAPLSPIDDIRGDAGYRLETAGHLVARAVRQAVDADG